MGEVTGMTASAMEAIAVASIVSGLVNGAGHLILTDHGGGTHDAGDVIGPQGPTGATGPQGAAGVGPVGTIVMHAATVAPSGWLICNGSAVSRTTYSALFASIGTKYGAGDGTTTFNVPDLRARFPRMDTFYFTNIGVLGGSDTHVHTVADHDHQVDGGSSPAVARITMNATAAPNIFMDRVSGVTSWPPTLNGDVSGGTGSSSNQTGGARVVGRTATGAVVTQAANNDPPYINLAFIIKT